MTDETDDEPRRPTKREVARKVAPILAAALRRIEAEDQAAADKDEQPDA